MATISELVAKHSKVPGDIRVRRQSWQGFGWFRPFYPMEDPDSWRGKTHSSPDEWFIGDDDDWELYEEPKPKVVRWLWVECATPGGPPSQCSVFRSDMEMHIVQTRYPEAKFIKLEWSRQEFPE